MIETFAPSSSHLDRVDYDDIAKTMQITFKDGRAYAYENVPQDVYLGLQNARSAGQYFQRWIKDRYSSTEV